MIQLSKKELKARLKAHSEPKPIDTMSSQTIANPNVGGSTLSKELLECTVCWGGGKVEVDDLGNDKDCTWCNGTGLVSRNL